jgi:hypothetical protein
MILDERLLAFRRWVLELPPPLVVADSWCSDSKLMQHVGHTHQGTLLVEGKQSYTFAFANGRQVKGQDLIQGGAWPWRHPCEARVRYVRPRATRGGRFPMLCLRDSIRDDDPSVQRFTLLT